MLASWLPCNKKVKMETTNMNKKSFLTVFLLLLLPGLSLAHGPSRQKVEKTVEINASPEKVWSIISEYCAISDWHPMIDKCESDGGNEVKTIRTLTLGNGELLREELLKYNPEKMMYQYMFKEPNLKAVPVSSYGSTIMVKPGENGGAILIWKSGFYRGYMNNDPPPELNDEAAVAAVTAVYEAGMASIKELAEK